MRNYFSPLAALGSLLLVSSALVAADPALALNPANPHYLLFRGRPTVLITSGEHYGAVLNRDFDYTAYLDELRAAGLNLTRTFSGTYREVPGSFQIHENTLAPAPDHFVSPWARSTQAGAHDGGNKFDLTAWNPAYFDRLHDFIARASERGIVVELSLFCTLYNDDLWAVNPQNAANNVNGVGKVGREHVYTLDNGGLLAVQDAFVRKIAAELKNADNVYFEICNEPYFAGVSSQWQDHIAATLADAEKKMPAKHLIARNIANGRQKIERPNPVVSIFNFHYATPPDTIAFNFGLQCPLADDETGFRGKDDVTYRTEGWEFMLAGGAIYSSLDYSFTCAHPDGTAEITTSPGGGSPALRRQLGVLRAFLDSFDLVKMKPAAGAIKGRVTVPLAGDPAQGAVTVHALADPGTAYAIYIHGGTHAQLALDLPAGTYLAEWINTRSGHVDRSQRFDHAGGDHMLTSPEYADDVALRLKRVEGN